MSKSNKFGFEPISPETPLRRERSVGPMGAAVREAAESLSETTEAKVEQRRKNAEDAKAFRAAQDEGRGADVAQPVGNLDDRPAARQARP